MKDRKPPEERDHKIYFESDNWQVIDIEKVDKLTVANLKDDVIRMDIDGIINSDTGLNLEGENINSSIWLKREFAEKLRDRLNEEL